jgi:hypothetical protein
MLFLVTPSLSTAQTNVFPANGFAGIGTTVPGFALTAIGTEWNSSQISLTTYAGTPISGGTDNYTPQFRFEKARGTAALPAIVEEGDRIGAFLAAGFDGSKMQRSAVFGFRIDGPTSSGTVPIGFFVQTGDASSNKPERLLVKSDGGVVISDLATGGGTRYVVANDTGLLSTLASPPGGSSEWAVTGNHIYNINSGRVGIGTTDPITKFHVKNGARVLFGVDTLGNGDKLMWLPDLHAFRVGSVLSGAASTYWNRDSIGLYSFASGMNTRAQGYGATAMGRDTEATNSYAFASGFFSNADGQYSTAMGFNTDALALGATALGYSTDAEENYSFAAGYFAEAQAIYAVAIGNAVQAQSYSSMAIGRYNIGGGNATTWVSTDPVFEIGIGTSTSARANAITVRKNGNVGIGTNTPLDALQVNGRIRFQTIEYFEDGGSSEIAANGDIRPTSDNVYDLGNSSFRWDDVYATNGTINTSDERDKSGITDITYGIEAIMQLRPVSFRWKDYPSNDPKLGLIAQDLQKVIPEVVKTYDFRQNEETLEMERFELDRLGVYYSDLIPVLVKGMQEQQTVIEAQKAEIGDQKEEVSELRDRLNALESHLAAMRNDLRDCCVAHGHTGQNDRGLHDPEGSDSPHLQQNMPNPFDRETLIRYYIPSNAGNAQIRITTIEGQLIQQYPIEGKGYGEQTVQGNSLTAGNYLYTLMVDGEVIATRKMVLMR